MMTDDAAYPADEWPKELPADLSMAARIEDTVGDDAGERWQVTQQTGAYEGWWVCLPDGHVVTADRALADRIANLPNLERDNAALREQLRSDFLASAAAIGEADAMVKALRGQLEAAEKAVSENAYDRDEWIRRCGDADGKVKALRELVREVMPFVREHGSWVIDETWMRRADALGEEETT